MVGSVNVDLVVRVDRLPSAGETVVGRRFARFGGGKGANQAVAAARLGAAVTFVGAVGDDAFGREAEAELRAEGIEIRVARLPNEPTGTAFIVVDRHGENQIAVASGANAALDAGTVEGLVPAGASFGSFVGNFEIPDDALLVGARAAVRAGARLIVDPAPPRPLNADLLAMRPILVPNAREAAALTGTDDSLAAAQDLHQRSGASVVVTLGGDGVLVFEGGTAVRLGAYPVEAADTTGAGDCFAGALAAELASGRALRDAAVFATAAAALAVIAPGARDAMPRREAVDRLVRIHGRTG